MTYANTQHTDILMDRFGLKVAGMVASSQQDLSYEVTERLRAARIRAVASRKLAPTLESAPVRVGQDGAAALLWGSSDKLGFWNGLGSLLPIAALVIGLITVQSVQDEARLTEIAAVDTALLTDDLPPQAYSDPGFVQFLKHQN